MAKKAPGKSFRKGLSLVDVFKMFPDDDAAEKWIARCRWGDEPACPHCGGVNVQVGAKHPSQNYRCREKGCRRFFSVRTGTAMASSKLGYQTWAIAAYLMSTELKGRASMKLHRDLNVTQKTAWFLAHRLREAWAEGQPSLFEGPVEVDETYVGGLKRNMPEHKRRAIPGRGPVGKTAVVAAKDRATKQVAAQVVERTDKDTLQIFVAEHVADDDVQIYTDDTSSYKGLPNPHDTVRHSAHEYVKYLEGEKIHTNGVESFWSMLKRAHKGTFHRISPKHLQRYVSEFAGRQNVRCMDTIDQMRLLIRGLEGKRLKYRRLVAD